MPKKIDLPEIIQNNPHIDPKLLQESMEVLTTLRRLGVPEREYQLVPPYAGERVQVADNPPEDPRTIHLNDG